MTKTATTLRCPDPAVQEAFTAWEEVTRRTLDADLRLARAEAPADVLREEAGCAFKHYMDVLQEV